MSTWGTPGRVDAAADAAIREVIVGYCRCVDTFADETLLEMFTEDGEWWRPHQEPLRGRAQIAAYLSGRDRAVPGRHIASNIIVELEGPERAKVISYYTVMKAAPNGGPMPSAMGEYHDVFQLDRGRWRIARRETRHVFRAK